MADPAPGLFKSDIEAIEALAEMERQRIAQVRELNERLDQIMQVLVRTETRLCKLIVHLGAKDEVKIKE